MPAPVTEALNRAINSALRDAQLRERFLVAGITPGRGRTRPPMRAPSSRANSRSSRAWSSAPACGWSRDGQHGRHRHRRRRQRGLHPRRAPVRGPGLPRAPAGSRAAGQGHLDLAAGRLREALRQREIRLALRDRARAEPERPPDPLAAREGARRLGQRERPRLPARQPPRLRPLGAGRRDGLVVRGGRARLPSHRALGRRTRSGARRGRRDPCARAPPPRPAAAAFVEACLAAGLPRNRDWNDGTAIDGAVPCSSTSMADGAPPPRRNTSARPWPAATSASRPACWPRAS